MFFRSNKSTNTINYEFELSEQWETLNNKDAFCREWRDYTDALFKRDPDRSLSFSVDSLMVLEHRLNQLYRLHTLSIVAARECYLLYLPDNDLTRGKITYVLEPQQTWPNRRKDQVVWLKRSGLWFVHARLIRPEDIPVHDHKGTLSTLARVADIIPHKDAALENILLDRYIAQYRLSRLMMTAHQLDKAIVDALQRLTPVFKGRTTYLETQSWSVSFDACTKLFTVVSKNKKPKLVCSEDQFAELLLEADSCVQTQFGQ